MAKLDLYVPERRRVVIRGRVQGIGFRLWLRNVADSLALAGSCRQLPDGSCEAIVQGQKTLVKQFVVACKRGPAEATVDTIETQTMPVDVTVSGFSVER